MTQESIGFIGLGNIGMPIAHHIVGVGFEMAVHGIAGDTSNSFYEERAPEGATIGSSVSSVTQQSSAIFLSLPSPGAVTAENPKRDQMYLYEYVRDGRFPATG